MIDMHQKLIHGIFEDNYMVISSQSSDGILGPIRKKQEEIQILNPESLIAKLIEIKVDMIECINNVQEYRRKRCNEILNNIKPKNKFKKED